MPVGLPTDRGTVVTVGTFDGVHRGHWAVLEEIRERAAMSGRRSVVLTFDPHPLAVVRPADAPKLLTTPAEKKEILAESGVGWTVFQTFTPELSRYEPERFVREILIDRLGMEELVIGHDHGFGRGRSGDAETLKEIGRRLGFSVDVVSPLALGSTPVSSTRVRRALEAGEVHQAEEALGRPYRLRGTVIEGDGRGADLGFPTANLSLPTPEKLVPAEGIYAVAVETSGGSFMGALHIGPRPVFEGAAPSVEVHILDFDGDLYGTELRISFTRRLRGVLDFDSVDALVAQMRRDVEEVRTSVQA